MLQAPIGPDEVDRLSGCRGVLTGMIFATLIWGAVFLTWWSFRP
jgi:hypothetical protein